MSLPSHRYCPTGYVGNPTSHLCEPCPPGCDSCTADLWCTQCGAGFYLFSGQCYTECPDGTFALEGFSLLCEQCMEYCSLCTSIEDCSQCEPNYYFNSVSKECVQCDFSCTKCDSSGCTVCNPGYFLLNRVCYSSCPEGYWEDSSLNACRNCTLNCESS